MDRKLFSLNLQNDLINSTDLEDLRKSFIETLAHDLKTPILAQIRALELMLGGSFGNFTQEQSEMLQLTLESSKYMYEMVSTLISTYKFDSGNFDLNYSEFNIVEVVENEVKNMEHYFIEKNIKAVIIPKIKNPFVSADAIRIQKVIQTLLLNSINSAYKNSVIKIIIMENTKTMTFKIENSSVFIPQERMNRMFRISNTESYDKIGMGIGLYLVKKIIEKHNGTVIAQSSINQKNILGFVIPTEVYSKYSNSA